ncbi:MAG: DinB family protein [Blastocatellia bacterium]|nr:DinB family protein [Blastocatellia bacterium]
MFRKVEDFIKAWDYEQEATLKLLNALSDASLGQKVTPDGRTMGFIAWHLAQTPPEMLGKAGLTLEGPAEDVAQPGSAAEIAREYEKASSSAREKVSADWNDEKLLEEDDLYGERWKKGLTLFYLIAHQAHHRGQMTVLMRQAGLPVTGVYGPAKEEWAAMGAPAMP